jgi:hypothetical protein
MRNIRESRMASAQTPSCGGPGQWQSGRLSCVCVTSDPNQSPKSWNKQKVATSYISKGALIVNGASSNTDGKYKHISSHSLQLKRWYLQAVRCLAGFSFITARLMRRAGQIAT